MQPHPVEAERPFEVVRRISLSAMDYENFISDLYADREFLGRCSHLCGAGEILRCLLVQQRGRADGILVLPVDGDYVGWAAYYPGPMAD